MITEGEILLSVRKGSKLGGERVLFGKRLVQTRRHLLRTFY